MTVESEPTPPASGTKLEIRPIGPADKAALAAAVDQSSDEAVYRRFLNPHGRLTVAELRCLTEVDHRDHEALLEVDPGSGKSVGVAHYVRDQERRDSAEIVFAVLEPDARRTTALAAAAHARSMNASSSPRPKPTLASSTS